MAGTASDYFENLVIDNLVRNTTKYLAIFTTNPNFETGASAVEATGGSYARKACAFSAASGGASANTALLEWTQGTDIAAGTYTGWALYDALTGGNMIFGDTFGTSKTLSVTGDKLSFAIGAVTLSVT